MRQRYWSRHVSTLVVAVVVTWINRYTHQIHSYLVSLLRASNSCLVRTIARVRKRFFTWSCVRHIMIHRYGTDPCQFCPLAPPAWLVVVDTDAAAACCCWALSNTTRSLDTSLVRNSIHLASTPGFCWSHSILCARFQLVGHGAGHVLYSIARRDTSFTRGLFCGRTTEVFGRRDHGSSSKEKRGNSVV